MSDPNTAPSTTPTPTVASAPPSTPISDSISTPDDSAETLRQTLLAFGQSCIRHAGTGLGGFLYAHGLISKSDGDQLAGILVASAALSWSWIYHSAQARKLTAAFRNAAIAAADRAVAELNATAAKTAVVVVLCVALLAGCGTPFGISVANIVDSNANKAAVGAVAAFGATAGLTTLESKGGVSSNVAVQQLNAAAATSAGNFTSAGLDWLASVLRQQQGTPNVASSSALASSLTSGGVPSTVATTVANASATAITKISSSAGVSANTANEVLATAINAAATAKAASPSARRNLRNTTAVSLWSHRTIYAPWRK
jgi:hypothetical protein